MGWRDWKRFFAPAPPPDKDRLEHFNSGDAQSAATMTIGFWPEPGKAADPELTAAGNELGLHIHGQLGSARLHENLVVSPISLQLLLAMAATGARGATQQEMGNVLGLDKLDKAADWPALFAEMMTALRQSAGIQDLRLANSIWVDAQCHVRPEFERQCRDSFHAEITCLDFPAPDAIARINTWASQKTNENISGVANRLGDQAGMRLVNCVYFYGKWRDPFEPLFTKDETFHALSGDVERPTMHQTRRFSYKETEEFQAVYLFYGYPCTLCLSVFLPSANLGLEAFVNGLDAKRWQTLSRGFSKRLGSLALPRFRIECSLGMKRALQTLGITKSFLAEEADFSGILVEPAPLWLDDVLQKTYLDVNERGTEAAAMTDTALCKMALEPRPEEPFRMVVDRPFFAAVTDLDSESLLFTASVWDV